MSNDPKLPSNVTPMQKKPADTKEQVLPQSREGVKKTIVSAKPKVPAPTESASKPKTTDNKTTGENTMRVQTQKEQTAKKPQAKHVKKAVSKKPSSKTVKKKTPAKPAQKAAVKKPAAQKPAPKKVAKKLSKNSARTRKSQTSKVQTPKKEAPKMPATQNFDFSKLSQEAANAGRENVEAFVKSSTIFAKGFEELMKTSASMFQNAAEKQAQFAKEMMGSKSLNEFAEAQNKIAQANMDDFMATSTKLSEMSVQLLTEAAEPINKQMEKTMKAAQKQAA